MCCNGHRHHPSLLTRRGVSSFLPEIAIVSAKSNSAHISQTDFNKTRAEAFPATKKPPMGGQEISKTLQIHSLLPFLLFKNSEVSYMFCTNPCFLVPVTLNT